MIYLYHLKTERLNMRTSVAKKFFGTSGGIRMRSKDMKARAEELAEGYQEAYEFEFDAQFRDFIGEFMSNNNIHHVTGKVMIITEDDVQGFIDSFTFPDEDEWAFDAVQSELDDVADAKYQQWKDDRC